MSDRTETEREAVAEDTRPGTADLVREADATGVFAGPFTERVGLR